MKTLMKAVLGLFLGMVALGMLINSNVEHSDKKYVTTGIQARELVKKHLKDPYSAKFEKTVVLDDNVTVCLVVRAKNSFGAYVRDHFVVRGFKVSNNAKDWNKYCSGKSGKVVF